MNKTDVKTFFDRLAPSWDAEMIRNDRVIQTILDNAGVTEGSSVLDVATGTGVLIPDYLRRNVGCILLVRARAVHELLVNGQVGVIGVEIRMILLCHLSVCFFDLVIRSPPAYAEDFVKITF